MIRNIVLTAKPRTGKSTLLNNIIQCFPNTFGFVTKEILLNSERVGFEIETSFRKKKILLAHVNLKTKHQISKYKVSVSNLEALIGITPPFPKKSLLYLDEIGQMQLLSKRYPAYVSRFLDSDNTLVATLTSVYSDNFVEELKKRDDVYLAEVTEQNRNKLLDFIPLFVGKIEKAKKYALEFNRFKIDGNKVTLASEHAKRKLVSKNGAWTCDCDFHKAYGVCSHSMATAELLK